MHVHRSTGSSRPSLCGKLAAVALLLAGTLIPVACGGGSSPPPPAVLAAHGSLGFSCQLDDCTFSGEATNNGAGCADNVRGITRLLDSSGGEIAREDWSLSPSRQIQAGETFLYQDCCFSLTEVSSMSSYQTDVFWNNVSCR